MTTKPRYIFKPNALKTLCVQILVAQILLAAFLGCTTKEEKKARHLEQAQQFIAEKKYKERIKDKGSEIMTNEIRLL